MTKNKPFAFILYGQPATKKNSSVIVKGHATLLPSKAYRDYAYSCRKALEVLKVHEKLQHFSMPVSLKCLYYLKNKAHYPDLIGLLQATSDIISDEYKTINNKRVLHTSWVLSDDRIIKNFDGSRIVKSDTNEPKTIVIVTPLNTNLEIETDPYIIKQLKEQNNLFF